MKKRLLLITTLSWLWLNIFAQARSSLEQYYYMGKNRPFTMVPVAGYHTATSNWYVEGRYNYEAINAVSVYVGKSFEKNAALSYNISPIAGVVGGSFNGGSVGANIALGYKRLAFSSQSQYTFSLGGLEKNFTYSWSDLTCRLNGFLSAGASLQQTTLYQADGTFEKGFLIKAEYKKLSVPLYIFNPSTNDTYFVLGLNYEW